MAPLRHVVITGASSGIGRAAAVAIAHASSATHLTLVARRLDQLHATEALVHEAAQASGAQPPQVRCHTADLASTPERSALVAALIASEPAVDVLVNNAGVGSDSDVLEAHAADEAAHMIELNLAAPIDLSLRMLETLAARPGPVIVNVSSVAGLIGTPDAPVYSATKWGLTGFSEALAARARTLGVRIVCIQPGPIPTPGWPHAWLDRRPVSRRLLSANAADVGAAIERAARGSGPSSRTIPRLYAAIPLVRACAPWLLRASLRRVATARPTQAARRLPSEP
jgi:short-subunit dehydrogenase